MESGAEQDTVHGRYPEYGAIFMSSRATRKECFNRRLFGLPSSQGHFVEQVKTGMILFLFEYERRELHGVFQACSDGAMNIFPRAYGSSGKRFPAQVKVKPIWHCRPLSESEFSYAIKENYFSKMKFNFGLSKTQVRRLLMLFSLRKLNDQHPQRVLSRSDDARPVYTLGKDIEVDDRRPALSDKLQTENNVGDDGVRLAIPAEYPSFFNPGMPVQGTYPLVEDQIRPISTFSHQMELPIISHSDTASYGDAFVTSTLPYDPDAPALNLLQSHSIGATHRSNSVQYGDAIVTSTLPYDPDAPAPNPSQSHSIEATHSSNSVQYGDAIVTSTLPYVPDAPALNLPQSHSIGATHSSISDQYADAIVTSTLPSDTVVPTLNLSQSLPIGANHSSNSVQDCYDRNDIPSLRNQLDEISKFGVGVLFTAPDLYDDGCHRNSVPFPGTAYSEEMAIESSEKHSYRGSLLQSSSAPASSPEIGSNGSKIKSPSTSERRCFDLPKNRCSVFSRLTLNSDVPVKENSTNVGFEENENDTSVDEVMAMLSESHYRWVKSKKSKPPTRKHDGEKFRNKKQTRVHSELKGNYLEMTPKKSNMASDTPTEDKGDQRNEAILFVNFKRRSELCKVNDETIARGNAESAGSEGLLGGQRKRRKLIRPKFSENDPRDDKNINGNTSLILQVSSHECSISEDANGKKKKLVWPNFRENEPCDEKRINGNNSLILQVSSQQTSIGEDASECCEALVGSQGKLLSQGAELLHVINQSRHENESINTERFPKYEREIKVESPGASLKIGDEGGKEPLSDVGSQIASLGIPYKENNPNAQRDLDYKDPMVNRLSRDCCENNHFTVQESTLQISKPNSGTGNGFSEIECGIGNELELLPRVELIPNSSDLTISNVMGSSSNKNFNLRRVAKEVASCVDAGIEDNHHVSSTKLSETSFETFGCLNKQESSQEHGSSIKLRDASFDPVGCLNKQESSQEHRSNTKLSEASLDTLSCSSKKESSQEHGSSSKLSEASFNIAGCLNKHESSQEHGSSTKLSEASADTAGCFNKEEYSQEVYNQNVSFEENLFTSNGCKSSEISTSKNVGDEMDVLPISSDGCKIADDGTIKKMGNETNVLPISSDGCKIADAGTSENMEDKKHVLPSSVGITECELNTAHYNQNTRLAQSPRVPSGEIRKRKLKTAYNIQNKGLAHELEFGDDTAIDDSERENKRLWSILTSRLKRLKNENNVTRA